jgi:uncharacterized protein involved in exopolysaccharide biosynthesis
MGDFTTALRRGWYVIGIAVIVAMAAGVTWSLQRSAAYSATATVVVANQTTPSSLGGVIQLPTNYTATQAELARSSRIVSATIQGVPDAPSPTDFLDESSVTASVGANLLTFTVSDDSEKGAVALANAYAESFVAFRQKADTQATEAVLTDVAAQLEELTAGLDALQAAGNAPSATTQSLYNSLIQTQQQMKTLRNFQVANTAVSSPAVAATRELPAPVPAGVFGALCGLILGLGIVTASWLRGARPSFKDVTETPPGGFQPAHSVEIGDVKHEGSKHDVSTLGHDENHAGQA